MIVVVTYITHGMMPSQEGEIRVTSTSVDFPLVHFKYKTRDERVEFLESLESRLDKDGMQRIHSESIELRADGSQVVRIYARLHSEQVNNPNSN